jgi:hypothetical protein
MCTNTQGRILHALWDNLLRREYYLRNVEKEVAELEHGNELREVWAGANICG